MSSFDIIKERAPIWLQFLDEQVAILEGSQKEIAGNYPDDFPRFFDGLQKRNDITSDFLRSEYVRSGIPISKNQLARLSSGCVSTFRRDLKIHHRGTKVQRFFMFFSVFRRLCGENSPKN